MIAEALDTEPGWPRWPPAQRSLFQRDARKYPFCGVIQKDGTARKSRIHCAPEAAMSPDC